MPCYKVSYHFNLTSSDFLFGLDVWVMFVIVEMSYLDIFGTCSRCVSFKHQFFFSSLLKKRFLPMWFLRSGDFPLHRGDQLLVGSRLGADQPGTIQSQAASWGNPGAEGWHDGGKPGGGWWKIIIFSIKSVKGEFFHKVLETEEFMWKKLWWLTSHDNLQNSPPQLTDPFLAKDRVETAPWFWSWPWLPILQKVCCRSFFSFPKVIFWILWLNRLNRVFGINSFLFSTLTVSCNLSQDVPFHAR